MARTPIVHQVIILNTYTRRKESGKYSILLKNEPYLSGKSSAMKFSTETTGWFSWIVPTRRKPSMRSWAPYVDVRAHNRMWNHRLKAKRLREESADWPWAQRRNPQVVERCSTGQAPQWPWLVQTPPGRHRGQPPQSCPYRKSPQCQRPPQILDKERRVEAGLSTQKAVMTQAGLTDVWSHARIQSGDHGLHRVLGFVEDRLDNMITCYSLGTQNSSDSQYRSLHTASFP